MWKAIKDTFKRKAATIIVSLAMLVGIFYFLRWYIKRKLSKLNPYNTVKEKVNKVVDYVTEKKLPKDFDYVNMEKAGVSESAIRGKLPYISSWSLGRLMSLEQTFGMKFFNFMRDALKQGCEIHIAVGFRSMSKQQEVLDRGLSNARPGKSWHQYGQAVDINVIEDGEKVSVDKSKHRNLIVGLSRKYGFDWGGHFRTFYDPPHFQYKKGKTIEQMYSQLKY